MNVQLSVEEVLSLLRLKGQLTEEFLESVETQTSKENFIKAIDLYGKELGVQ